jgi:hypothetical protein
MLHDAVTADQSLRRLTFCVAKTRLRLDFPNQRQGIRNAKVLDRQGSMINQCIPFHNKKTDTHAY